VLFGGPDPFLFFLDAKMEKVLQISKLDAARRQLETAIQLYFSNSEPVSIHTLTAAAYIIIRDINKTRGGSPMIIKDLSFEYIKPEAEKIWAKKMNEAENHFKHGCKDHDKTLDFRPELTEYYILDAIRHYFTLTNEFSPIFQTFHSWFIVSKPDMFKLQDEHAKLIGSQAPNITSMGRKAYFNMALPHFMSINQSF
jgi:hypothetical protein